MFLATSRGQVIRNHFGIYKWWTAYPSSQRYVRLNMYVRFVGPDGCVATEERKGIFAFRPILNVNDSTYASTRRLYPDRVVEDRDLRPDRNHAVKVCTLVPYEMFE